MLPGGNQCHAMYGPATLTAWEQEDYVSDENELKIEINTFVWGHAPAAMPIGKADEMACKIFELFMAARSEHQPQEKSK